jgi:hypothetical protein
MLLTCTEEEFSLFLQATLAQLLVERTLGYRDLNGGGRWAAEIANAAVCHSVTERLTYAQRYFLMAKQGVI